MLHHVCLAGFLNMSLLLLIEWSYFLIFFLVCFSKMFDLRRFVKPCFQPGSFSKVLTIANFRQAKNRNWNCAENKFWLRLITFCSSDDHHTTSRLPKSLFGKMLTRWNPILESSIWYEQRYFSRQDRVQIFVLLL